MNGSPEILEEARRSILSLFGYALEVGRSKGDTEWYVHKEYGTLRFPRTYSLKYSDVVSQIERNISIKAYQVGYDAAQFRMRQAMGCPDTHEVMITPLDMAFGKELPESLRGDDQI